MATERDPEVGSILEEVEAAAENVLNPVVSAGGAMADAASAVMDEWLDGGDGGSASGGGESGGGGSTDPWGPITPAQDPKEPMFVLPPDVLAIITGEADPGDPIE